MIKIIIKSNNCVQINTPKRETHVSHTSYQFKLIIYRSIIVHKDMHRQVVLCKFVITVPLFVVKYRELS